MLISDDWRQKNAELHEANPEFGTSGNAWLGYVLETIEEEGFSDILDYGCGKGTLAEGLRATLGLDIAEYDPAIEAKHAEPNPAELVVCTDVLEHIEPECLDNVLADLVRVTKTKLLFDVAICKSQKTMRDGSDVHRIVEKPDWWKEQLERFFDVTVFISRPEFSFAYGEAVPKGMGQAEKDRKAALPKRRRKVTPDLVEFFGGIRKAQSKADAFSRIDTIRLYEGIGDQKSDMHVIFDWLDDEADPETIIKEALSLTRKALVVRAAVTEERTPDWWRAIFDKYTRVMDWQAANGIIVGIGSPMLGVQGVTVKGVVDTDDCWEQVKASIARITKRVKLSPAHKRRAIVACYGPSLRNYVTRLSDEVAECEGQADIISVSGAHDFLLSNGVVPTYHVECDPRPHKADNIAKAHEGAQYLLGSVAHPVLFDKLEGADISLWHVGTMEHSHRLVKELGEDGQLVIPGGGSVGLRAIPLLYGMGYRDFSIYGMDCSFADEGQTQWAGAHAGKRQDIVNIYLLGRSFASSPQLITYATDFLEMIQKVEDWQFRVYGDGLLAAMCVLHSKLAA